MFVLFTSLQLWLFYLKINFLHVQLNSSLNNVKSLFKSTRSALNIIVSIISTFNGEFDFPQLHCPVEVRKRRA